MLELEKKCRKSSNDIIFRLVTGWMLSKWVMKIDFIPYLIKTNDGIMYSIFFIILDLRKVPQLKVGNIYRISKQHAWVRYTENSTAYGNPESSEQCNDSRPVSRLREEREREKEREEERKKFPRKFVEKSWLVYHHFAIISRREIHYFLMQKNRFRSLGNCLARKYS